MIYDQIEIGDVLVWKLMGNQSKMVVVVKSEEQVVYGSGKGKEKKWKTVFYVRGLYSFDEEPEPVDLADLKQNCSRPKTAEPVVVDENGEPLESREYGQSEIVLDEYSQYENAEEFREIQYDEPTYNDKNN